MEGKCARIEKTAPIDSHSPNIIAAAGYCINAITVCTRIRAWHYRPCVPVPMHCESLFRSPIAPRGPHVVAAAGNSTEIIKISAYVRTCYARPCATVPVQRERHARPARRNPVGSDGAPPLPTWLVSMIVVHTNGPHVVATAGCSENVVMQVAWVRAWYQRPCAPVPVDCQRSKVT
jgi:hypothetical protein